MRMAFGHYISAAALVLCSLLVLLWVRSYDRCEYSNRFDGGVTTVVGSNKGTMYFFQIDTPCIFPNQSKQYCSKVADRQGNEFALEWTLQRKRLVVPYRMAVPLVVLIGVAPWIRSKRSLVDVVLIAAPHIPGIIARLH